VTHDGVFVRDLDNVITYWNRGAEQLYGWKPSEAIGQVSHDLMRTVFPVPYEAITAELFRTRTGRWEGELVHSTKDGRQIDVASRWSLQRDERSRPLAILETNNDISATKKAQSALLETRGELARASRIATLGEMSASIAHEVNQPLAAIVTNGEASLRWLKRDQPDIGEAIQALTRIVSDGNRASGVIRKIRDLAKKAEPDVAPLDINQVIREVIALTRHEAAELRASVRLQLAADLPSIQGDRVQLQQVILNLVMNALQAMAPVTNRARVIYVRTALRDTDRVSVAVEDAGVGMATATPEELFSTFYTTKTNGMGMGLSISRSIVEAHGGSIWAKPNEGPGMTFEFTICAGDGDPT
jgi:PAS domain S-box-containing protein